MALTFDVPIVANAAPPGGVGTTTYPVGVSSHRELLEWPCVFCGHRWGVQDSVGWNCDVCEWRVGDVPDPDIRPTTVHVVYYVRFGDRIKIGTSGRPRQRLSAIPHDELLAFEPGDRMLEQKRHLQFAVARLGTSEWFAATPRLLAHARELRGATDPWRSYARWRSHAARATLS